MSVEIIHYNAKLNTGDTALHKFYNKLRLDTDSPFIDRYRILPHYLNLKPYFLKISPLSKPLESDKSFKMSFEDVCNERAISLLKTNKIINIFWSGGLDSTVALLSLISNCNDINQIRILATYSSILESGYFYDTFLKPYNSRFNVTQTVKKYNENEIYLTGGNGNQLFTTGNMHIKDSVRNYNDLQKPYKDIVNPEKYEFYEPAIMKSPKPIKNYEDFLWFESFAFKWEHQRYDILMRYEKPKNIKKYLDKFLSFFYTSKFEQWSIDNNEQQHDTKNFITTTKLPMRKYIFKQLGDKSLDYVNNKKISPSMFLEFFYKFKYITTDFEVH
jgi:hypothetical protein